MRKKHFKILGVLTIIIILSINTFLVSASSQETFRFPAEFESQEAIWIAWNQFEEFECVYEMIEALIPHVKVKIMAKSASIENEARNNLITRGIPLDNISFHRIQYYEYWLRDIGPIFIVGSNGTKKIVDFDFNGYGYPLEYGGVRNIEEKVDVKTAQEQGLEVLQSDLVSEGGDREFNGLGTMIVNETVELHRNPDLTKEQMEDEFERTLGVEKVIWIKGMLVEDYPPFKGLVPGSNGELTAYPSWGTGGHVDEIARFVDSNTILLSEVTEEEAAGHPIAAINREVLEECYQILSNETDQDGNAFNIIRVTSAEPNYTTISPDHDYYKILKGMNFEDGSILPNTDVQVLAASSYMNFLIANNVVLVPKFWEPGKPIIIQQKDEEFVQVMESVYPDKEIVQINPLELNFFGGGGMHCITQQEPLVD